MDYKKQYLELKKKENEYIEKKKRINAKMINFLALMMSIFLAIIIGMASFWGMLIWTRNLTFAIYSANIITLIVFICALPTLLKKENKQ